MKLTAMILAMVIVLMVATLANLATLASNEYGYNFDLMGFEDGSHVLNIGVYQMNWCEHNAPCDNSDMRPVLEVRMMDDPYQG